MILPVLMATPMQQRGAYARSLRGTCGAVALCFAIFAPVAGGAEAGFSPDTGSSEVQISDVIPGEVTQIVEAIRVDEMLAVLAEEELHFAEDLRVDMLPDVNMLRWKGEVSAALSSVKLKPIFVAAFSEALAQSPKSEILALSTDPLMVKAMDLEIKARRLLLDPTVEEAAIERAAKAGKAPRIEALSAHIETLDLIETNVTGSLNSNLIFYRELVRGGAFPYEVSEQDILGDVAGEADSLRQDIEEWLLSYLYMAYAPLSDREFDDFVKLGESDAGRALYRASEAAYDAVFAQNSKVLGAMVAGKLVGEEL